VSNIVPAARPQLSVVDAKKLLAAYGVSEQVAILGIRGYYLDTMGTKGKNDRGIFDDAIIVVSPRSYQTFNGNTDPSAPDTGTRLATLCPGVWQFKKGVHHPASPAAYPCLVQAGPVKVKRDNGITEVGEFYIHIHHGGFNTTTSEGCQTIYRPQWGEFWTLVTSELAFYRAAEIPYCLTEQEET
jgi:lysozyme